jgi:DNA-binding response OmpR family regulator
MSRVIDILIVEDDDAIATGLILNLKLEGYSSRRATDGEQGLAMIEEARPDLVLLDLGLPKKDGLELLTALKDSGRRLPVIVLSAREGEYDKVAALRLGADDYVTKPFALAELMARVAAVLRRTQNGNGATEQGTLEFGQVQVNLKTRSVTKRGNEIKLTHLEFELLAYFLSRPNEVVSRTDLLQRVWGSHGSPRTVDNFVAQLRGKLEDDPENPRYLTTVRGSGYRFNP